MVFVKKTMWRSLVLVLFSTLIVGVPARSVEELPEEAKAEPSLPDRVGEVSVGDELSKKDMRPELWFPVGEEIEYRVYWGRIPVGTAVVTTEWNESGDEGPLLAIRVKVDSNRVIETIYPVDIQIESLIDPDTFLPVRFTQNRHEGRRHTHEITKFDHEAGVAHWESLSRDREDTFELEPDTRDLLSFAYYMRKLGFERDERRHFRVMADDKIYDLWLDAQGDERIRLRHYGRVRSIEVEPEAAFEGLFVRRGRMQLWVSDDDRQLMTQMVGSIPVASIRLVLQRVRGPGNDSWILDYD